MDTPRSRATSGRMPMMTNSVVPIAKAASANARIGSGKRLLVELADGGDDAAIDAQGRAIGRRRKRARHIGDEAGDLVGLDHPLEKGGRPSLGEKLGLYLVGRCSRVARE